MPTSVKQAGAGAHPPLALVHARRRGAPHLHAHVRHFLGLQRLHHDCVDVAELIPADVLEADAGRPRLRTCGAQTESRRGRHRTRPSILHTHAILHPGSAGAQPGCHWARAGRRPGRGAGSSKGPHTDKRAFATGLSDESHLRRYRERTKQDFLTAKTAI